MCQQLICTVCIVVSLLLISFVGCRFAPAINEQHIVMYSDVKSPVTFGNSVYSEMEDFSSSYNYSSLCDGIT
jgi:Cu/Ag efflux pump CusA